MKIFFKTFFSTVLFATLSTTGAYSQEASNTPTPGYEAKGAVDGYHIGLGGTAGAINDEAVYLGTITLAAPIPFIPQMGIQVDLAYGEWNSAGAAASGLHIFWRDPSIGMLGAYGDWAYNSPQHGGRVGAEFAVYLDRFTVDGVLGGAFGQDIDTEFFDEIDFNYYVTDDFKASIGHRLTSRGHVGNVGLEWKAPLEGASVRLFAEGEYGQDDYSAVFAGLRIGLGTTPSKSLIQEDRENGVRVRVPRNFASISECTKKSDGIDLFCGTKKGVAAKLAADK